MRRMIAFSLAVFATGAAAKDVSVVQNRQANVFGLVQAGSQVGSVTVRQTGQANMAGIVQAGPSPRARIEQSGGFNSAFVGQVTTSIRGGGLMP